MGGSDLNSIAQSLHGPLGFFAVIATFLSPALLVVAKGWVNNKWGESKSHDVATKAAELAQKQADDLAQKRTDDLISHWSRLVEEANSENRRLRAENRDLRKELGHE